MLAVRRPPRSFLPLRSLRSGLFRSAHFRSVSLGWPHHAGARGGRELHADPQPGVRDGEVQDDGFAPDEDPLRCAVRLPAVGPEEGKHPATRAHHHGAGLGARRAAPVRKLAVGREGDLRGGGQGVHDRAHLHGDLTPAAVGHGRQGETLHPHGDLTRIAKPCKPLKQIGTDTSVTEVS
eukprot:1195598-Prorocentrum_minimum.AAC.4